MGLPDIETLRGILKEAGQLYFAYAMNNVENMAKGKERAEFRGSYVATLKMDMLFRAVSSKQELHASAEDLLEYFVILRSAFLEFEREALSQEVHLWNNISMSQSNERCRALWSLKIGLDKMAKQLRV